MVELDVELWVAMLGMVLLRLDRRRHVVVDTSATLLMLLG